MNVQSVCESLYLTEQVQTQVLSLKRSEVYLSIDIRYGDVITNGNTFKKKKEFKSKRAGRIQCIGEICLRKKIFLSSVVKKHFFTFHVF